MLNICLSFDYELFLGKNFLSADDILFNPTSEIIKILNSADISGTFFADVCSVFQHERYKKFDYCEKFTNQIQNMAQQNQDVQLHIHSNWLLSKPDRQDPNNSWNISTEGYTIHDFDNNSKYDESVDSIIKKGKKYLMDSLCPVNADYNCIAYRAGGFSIQPEENLLQILLNNGIVIDSSVAPKLKDEFYNFCNVPSMPNWWINPKSGLENASRVSSGCIYEVPVATVRNNIFRFAKNPFKTWHVRGAQGRGECMQGETDHKEMFWADFCKQIYRRSFGYGILSLDSRGHRILMGDIKKLYRQWSCDKSDATICIICHPKLASRETLLNMSHFIEEVKKDGERFRFVSLQDVYNNMMER